MGTAAVCIGTGRLCHGREKAFLYFYDVLGFSTELIVYLIEICVSNNHTSIRYI